MLYKIIISLAHVVPVMFVFIVINIWRKYIHKQKTTTLEKRKELETRFDSAEKKLMAHRPEIFFHMFLDPYEEKKKEVELEVNLIKVDKICQQLLTEYVLAKFDYFEFKGITFYQSELFRILKITSDENLSDKIYKYLIDKNVFYTRKKELESIA